MGWVYDEANNKWNKKIRKYTYDDYWDWIFSDSPTWTGQRHPDYSTHGAVVTTYGSLKDYYKEVSYNNLIIEPAQIRTGSGKYNTGIINEYDEVNGKKFIRWITMPNAKSTYGNGPLVQVLTVLTQQYNEGKIQFNPSTYTGKFLTITAGGGPGGIAQLSGRFLSAREKRWHNYESRSTLDGIGIIVHEFGHSIGFGHLAASMYDPMNPSNNDDRIQNLYCPQHINPIYKLQKGWLSLSDATKISSNGSVSIPSITSSSKKVGVVTVYGDAGRNGNWNHSEYFVLEYRIREKFNRFAGGINPSSFTGGVLVWHYSKYKVYVFSQGTQSQSSPIGMKLAYYVGTTLTNYADINNFSTFKTDLGDPIHFFHPNHSYLGLTTTPNSKSGVGLATGITLYNFAFNSNKSLITVNVTYNNGSVPSYSNLYTSGGSITSISGNSYIDGLLNTNLTVADGSTVDFSPSGFINVEKIIAIAATQNSIKFRGAGFGNDRVLWNGIIIRGYTSASTVQRCLISQASSGIRLNFDNTSLEPIISNNLFQNCQTDLYLSNIGSSFKEMGGYDNNSFSSLKISGKWKLTTQSAFTISSGAIMDIYPATSIEFGAGRNLYCYGKLTANGNSNQQIIFTRSGTSGNWGSIVLNGSGSAGSSLNYVNMSYGTNVQAINTSGININNFNCLDNGTILFNNSSGTIQNSKLSSPVAYGDRIIVTNGSNVNCYTNQIWNGYLDVTESGIGYSYGSTGKIGQNDISNIVIGISITNGSSPKFASPNWYRNNRITNCSMGILIYNNSYPLIGYDPASGCGGANSIHSNYNFDIALSTPNFHLNALGTYWTNGNPNNAKFSIAPGSNIDKGMALSIDPWLNEPLPSGTQSNNIQIAETDLSTENTQINFTSLNQPEGISKSTISVTDSLAEGIQLRNQGKFSDAKNFFVSYLGKNPKNQRAYVELYNCADSSTLPDLIRYFNTLPQQADKEQKLLLSYLYLKNGDIKSAKEINQSIVDNNPNTAIAMNAKLNNFYLTLYSEDDPEAASSILNEVISKKGLLSFSLDGKSRGVSPEISTAKYALDTYVQPPFDNGVKIFSKNIKEELVSEIPKSFELFNNYPNPFNPTTTISYSLPHQSSVDLIIYDIMGREVKSFKFNSQAAGTQSITWDGTNGNGSQVSSGVYIYRIVLKSLETNEAFTKTSKMMLMK